MPQCKKEREGSRAVICPALPMLPTIKIGDANISRLIVGGNPFSGNSHVNGEVDQQMREYFSTARIKETLFRCMENGINTMQMRGDMHIMRMIMEFRQDGGDMHWIAQTASEYGSHEGNVNQIMSYKPAAIYHHGSLTDSLFKAGRYEELKQRLEVIRGTGVPVGLGTHMPEVLEYAEEHNWDVDFYMASVYNLSLGYDRVSSAITGKANTGERFEEEDIPVMYRMIRQVSKPCLAFKILGATRRCATQETVRAAFDEAFENIKDTDAVVVGMYPKNEDQPRLNSLYTEEAIRRAEALRKAKD